MADIEDGSIDQLIEVILEWHANGSKIINQILGDCEKEGPDHKIRIKHEGGEIIVEGEKLRGFLAGLRVAMTLFGKLPFKAVMSDEEIEDDFEDDFSPAEAPEVIVRPEEFGNFS